MRFFFLRKSRVFAIKFLLYQTFTSSTLSARHNCWAKQKKSTFFQSDQDPTKERISSVIPVKVLTKSSPLFAPQQQGKKCGKARFSVDFFLNGSFLPSISSSHKTAGKKKPPLN